MYGQPAMSPGIRWQHQCPCPDQPGRPGTGADDWLGQREMAGLAFLLLFYGLSVTMGGDYWRPIV